MNGEVNEHDGSCTSPSPWTFTCRSHGEGASTTLGTVLALLRWLVPATLPAVLFAVLVHRTDERREPPWLVVTHVRPRVGGRAPVAARRRASRGADRARRARLGGGRERRARLPLLRRRADAGGRQGRRGVARVPVEALRRALRRRRLRRRVGPRLRRRRERLRPPRAPDGRHLARPRASSRCPRTSSSPASGATRSGAPSTSKARIPIFPAAFVATIVAHGLYAHFVYGRGPGALLAVTPLLAVDGLRRVDARARPPRAERPALARPVELPPLPPVAGRGPAEPVGRPLGAQARRRAGEGPLGVLRRRSSPSAR